MLDELLNRTTDIYIGLGTGLASGIPCTLLGLLIDRLSERKQSSGSQHGGSAAALQQRLTITQAVQVGVTIAPAGRTGSDYIGLVFALAAWLGYLFFRSQILAAAIWFPFAFLGLWCGIAVRALWRGAIGGLGWLLSMAAALLFSVLLVVVVGAANTPDYAPQFFAQWQQYANAYGVVGIVKSGILTGLDVLWLGLHVVGVIVLFLAIRDAVEWMIFFAGIKAAVVSGRQPWWLSQRMVRFDPYRATATIFIMLALAYCLVDGLAFIFVTQQLPLLAQELMNRVLYGTRGVST